MDSVHLSTAERLHAKTAGGKLVSLSRVTTKKLKRIAFNFFFISHLCQSISFFFSSYRLSFLLPSFLPIDGGESFLKSIRYFSCFCAFLLIYITMMFSICPHSLYFCENYFLRIRCPYITFLFLNLQFNAY